MKIAVLCHLDHPIVSPFSGGLEAHTWHLCQSLIQRGHEVVTFASGDSDPRLNVYSIVESGLFQSSLSVSQREEIKTAAYQKALTVIHQGRFDIIHNNSLNTLPLTESAGLEQPMVTVLHTPPFEKLAKAAWVSSRASSAKFIAVSKLVSSRWQPYVNSQTVYNGIDIGRWPFSPVAQANLAIWFGRFVPEKSPHEAIIAARMAGFKINIAGPIANVDYFREQIEPLLEDNNVRYLGHLSHEQLKTAIGQSAVFVKTPLWEEPYGLVYAESLACGTPVATFKVGAAQEILTPACGRMVASRSLESLAQAIGEAAQLSRSSCRQRAETFCQLDRMVSAYEAIYERAMRERLETAVVNSVAA